MEYRRLGSTGILISALSFGAGPVSGLIAAESPDRQRQTIRRALDAGINWFDTAATYGDGASEAMLGESLRDLGAVDAVIANELHVATKVRFLGDDLSNTLEATRRSVSASFKRLGLPRVTLLQLHNSITSRRDDEPTSITPGDVLGPRGVIEAFRALREEGIVEHLGITGIGAPEALREVLASGAFATMQTPYHLLNPSAGLAMPPGFSETNYGQIIDDCQRLGVGVMAIRVFAGGALAGQAPSAHTHKTKFFPLALYERDVERARRLAAILGDALSPASASLRFVLGDARIASAIVGFAEGSQIDAAVNDLRAGPLPASLLPSIVTLPLVQ